MGLFSLSLLKSNFLGCNFHYNYTEQVWSEPLMHGTADIQMCFSVSPPSLWTSKVAQDFSHSVNTRRTRWTLCPAYYCTVLAMGRYASFIKIQRDSINPPLTHSVDAPYFLPDATRWINSVMCRCLIRRVSDPPISPYFSKKCSFLKQSSSHPHGRLPLKYLS